MDKGAWRVTVHGGHKESDTTGRLTDTYTHTLTRVCLKRNIGSLVEQSYEPAGQKMWDVFDPLLLVSRCPSLGWLMLLED